MAEARWNIWIHLVQSLLKHGHQSRVPSHPVQVAFEYLQGWSFHNLCSLYSITSTAQKCIPAFRENLLCCSLCPLLHALALIIIKKRCGPFSLYSPFKYYIYWWGLSWAFPFPGWRVPALSVSPHRKGAPVPSSLDNLVLDSLQYVHVLRSPEVDTVLHVASSVLSIWEE